MDAGIPVDRVVEVLHDRGEGMSPRWMVGSGFLIGGPWVLTAAHCVGGADGGGTILVRHHDGTERSAGRVMASGDGADVGVLRVEDPTFGSDLDPIEFARVDRQHASVIAGCEAIGFPRFKERPVESRTRPPLRDSAHVRGEIPTGAGLKSGLLELHVTATPRALGGADASEWAGMSGAVVFVTDCGARFGRRAVGVVAEHHPPEGESALTVVPITDLTAAAWAEIGRDADTLPSLPRPAVRPPHPYAETVAELARRTPVLLDREEPLADLAAFATGTEGYRWLVGGPYAGKTALAAHFVRSCPPSVDCVSYFLVARRSDADSGRFTTVVNAQLARLLGVDPPTPADDPDLLRGLWAQAVQRAEHERRHLLLVVDGLDEDLSRTVGRPSVAALLPSLVGGCAHVLITSRRHPDLPSDVDVDHPLCRLDRERRHFALPPSAHAAALRERAEQELTLALSRADELAFACLGWLAGAEGALSMSDLVEVAGAAGRSISAWRFRDVVSGSIGRVLEREGGAPNYRYTFAHESLRERSVAAFGADLVAYRAHIVAWGDSWRDREWPTDDTPAYFLEAYPAMLYRHHPDHLPALLRDVGYLDTVIRSLGAGPVAATVHAALGDRREDGRLALVGRCLDLEAHHLPPNPLVHPARQLCLQAMRLGASEFVTRATRRLARLPRPLLVPSWTSQRICSALVRTLTGHDGPVWAVAVTVDGSHTVSGGNDGTVRLWDLSDGRPLGEPLTGHDGAVSAVAVSADGNRAVSGGGDGTLRLWDLSGGRPLGEPLTGHDSAVWAVAVSADGRRAVSGGGDGTLRLWDLSGGRPLGEPLTGHDGAVWAVAVSADGRRAVSGGGDGTLRLWDLSAGWPLGEPLTGHAGAVRAVAVSADGRRVISGSGDGSLWLWDPSGRRSLGPLTGHHGPVRAVAVSADGRRAVSCGEDGTVRLWDLSGRWPQGEPLTGHHSPVCAVAISADGRRAVSGGEDGTVRLWDLSARRLLGKPPAGHGGPVRAVAVSADGRRALSGGYEGMVRLWDVSGRRTLGEPLAGHGGPVCVVAISANGCRAVSGGYEGAVRVWDLSGGRPLGEPLTGHRGPVWGVAISSDGSRALSGGQDGMVRLWDLSGERPLGEPLTGHDGPVWAVAVSGDSRRALSGGQDGMVRLWDLSGGWLLGKPLGGHDGPVWAVAVSGDGRHAVSGGDDGTIRMWDLSGRRPLGEPLTGHDGPVWAVTFSGDGRRAVSGGDDGTIRMWEVGSARPVDMVAADGPVRSVAISQLGSNPHVVTSHGADITVWTLRAT